MSAESIIYSDPDSPEDAANDVAPQAVRLETPAGVLVLRTSGGAITSVDWLKPGRSSARTGPDVTPSGRREASPLLAEAARQLEDYFAGRRHAFDLPLSPKGSPFHLSVWREMQEIPYGQTMTYGELARRVGGAAQPVGSACGANPIPIIIPCHRVVAADGLGGFSGGGGIESKRFLLRHEGALEPELDLFGPQGHAAG